MSKSKERRDVHFQIYLSAVFLVIINHASYASIKMPQVPLDTNISKNISDPREAKKFNTMADKYLGFLTEIYSLSKMQTYPRPTTQKKEQSKETTNNSIHLPDFCPQQ